MIIAVSITIGLLVAWITFRSFFDDLSDFFDCLRLYFTPEIISIFRGEWRERNWADLKLLVYFGLSGGVGFLSYQYLGAHFH